MNETHKKSICNSLVLNFLRAAAKAFTFQTGKCRQNTTCIAMSKSVANRTVNFTRSGCGPIIALTGRVSFFDQIRKKRLAFAGNTSAPGKPLNAHSANTDEGPQLMPIIVRIWLNRRGLMSRQCETTTRLSLLGSAWRQHSENVRDWSERRATRKTSVQRNQQHYCQALTAANFEAINRSWCLALNESTWSLKAVVCA